jgi:glycine/D-amino acid oxidase-like deaminating enzyme
MLAEELGGGWGYRRLDTLRVIASARHDISAFRSLEPPDWLGPDAAVHARLGTTETTAQVDPAEFTKGMMAAAIDRGARLQIGYVTGITRTADRSTADGVIVDGERLAGDAVVIAMGPWSALAGQWLPLPAVYGLKGHSLVFRNEEPISPQAMFVELEAEDGTVHAPEIFSRPNGTTYVCGLPSEAALPADPSDVAPDSGAYETLRAMTARLAPKLAAGELLAAQTCYRPVVRDGLPLIGRVPGVAQAYVATGHSVWGMLNGPATGEAMAELIVDGAASTVDIAPFDPARLEPRAVRTADPWATRPPRSARWH